MFLCLSIVIIALIWLLIETNFMSIRLPVGKSKTQGILLLQASKVQPILMLPEAKQRWQLHLNMSEWDTYNRDHEQELERERIERLHEQVETKRHYCPICKKNFDIYVKTQTFIIGNSTFTVTGCPTCVETYRIDVEKIQTTKHKPSQSVKAPYQGLLKLITYDKKRNWETNEVYKENVLYHDSLVSKEWLEQHIKDEYPEPTIEISVNDGKTIHVNGNYKKGLIGEFISQYKSPKIKKAVKT